MSHNIDSLIIPTYTLILKFFLCVGGWGGGEARGVGPTRCPGISTILDMPLAATIMIFGVSYREGIQGKGGREAQTPQLPTLPPKKKRRKKRGEEREREGGGEGGRGGREGEREMWSLREAIILLFIGGVREREEKIIEERERRNVVCCMCIATSHLVSN